MVHANTEGLEWNGTVFKHCMTLWSMQTLKGWNGIELSSDTEWYSNYGPRNTEWNGTAVLLTDGASGKVGCGA